jgi:hypothetical protein
LSAKVLGQFFKSALFCLAILAEKKPAYFGPPQESRRRGQVNFFFGGNNPRFLRPSTQKIVPRLSDLISL